MQVSFGMYYEAYGRQTVTVPDTIDKDDLDGIKAYIKEHWDDIPLPTDADYVSGSDEMDEEGIFEVMDDEGRLL